MRRSVVPMEPPIRAPFSYIVESDAGRGAVGDRPDQSQPLLEVLDDGLGLAEGRVCAHVDVRELVGQRLDPSDVRSKVLGVGA